LQQMYTQMRQ